jgi:hypothetical protein
MNIFSEARGLSTKLEERKEQNSFGEDVASTKIIKPNTILALCPGEDAGFGYYFYGIQRYVSNYKAYEKLSDNKDWQLNESIFRICPQ